MYAGEWGEFIDAILSMVFAPFVYRGPTTLGVNFLGVGRDCGGEKVVGKDCNH